MGPVGDFLDTTDFFFPGGGMVVGGVHLDC